MQVFFTSGAADPVRRVILPAAVVACLATSPLPGQWRTPAFQAEGKLGFDHIFNLEHAEAARSFEALERRYPENPGPPIYRASAILIQELFSRRELALDRLVSPGHFTSKSDHEMAQSQRQSFAQLLARARRICEKALKEVPGDVEARYFLGALHMVQASFEITINRSYRRAASEAKTAYRLHRDIIEHDPEFYDAYLTVGIFEYIIGSLPWYMKLPARIAGFTGNKERGLAYLEQAIERSSFVDDNARAMKVVAMVREGRLGEALALAETLHATYPRNYIMHLNRAQILERMARTDSATAVYEDFIARVEAGEDNYRLAPLGAARLEVARRLLLMDQPERAERILARSVEREEVSAREKVWPTLELGRSLDLQGKRDDAVARYLDVLELPAAGDAHKVARKCLKRACTSY